MPRIEWLANELERDRQLAIEQFRRERLEEPLEEYGETFDRVQGIIEELLEGTVDLSQLEEQALEILTAPLKLEGFRYLAGPPISLDDLKVLVDSNSLSPQELRRNPTLVQRLVATIRDALDRRRFPWVTEGREPTEAEREAAIVATTALIATQRVATTRRSTGKQAQEEAVRQILLSAGFQEINISSRQVATLRQAPSPGQFCGAVKLSGREADLIVGLWDGRVMPIECKVSNSSTNSVKRLNNDAAVKAETWRTDLGATQIVPAAVLSGVYKLHNLQDAQQRGLTLFWAHRLSDLTSWIETTR